MENTIKVKEYLSQHDIKPSYQRIKIFDYLIERKNHPTVDTIYKELVSGIPTLSKTTVYNTLKLFLDKEIVQVINIEDNETRFDADVSNHGHFKCKKCNKIYDFKLNESEIKIAQLEGFTLEEQHVYLKGTCKKCCQVN